MARLIRAGSSLLTGTRVEALDSAERIRRLALADAEQIRERARQEGLAAGRAESAALLVELASARAKALHDAEAALIPLVRSVVERVVHASLEEDASRITSMVRAHLERLQRAQQGTIHVHPDDLAALTAAELGAPWTLLPDASLVRGDVIVVSNLGRVDARLHVQLDALEAALRAAQARPT